MKPTRKRFCRFLTREQVNLTIDMLNAGVGSSFPYVKARQGTFKIKAPDGDEVFSGLKHPSGTYICLLHREVFSEKVV